MATPLFEEAPTGPVPIPGMAPMVPTRARHSEPPAPRGTGVSSVALVICVITVSIAVVCVALAAVGDTASAALIAFFPIVLGFITACIFNKRWR